MHTSYRRGRRVFVVIDVLFIEARQFSTCWLVEAIEHVVDMFRHVHSWYEGRDTSWGRVLGGFDIIEALVIDTRWFSTCWLVGAVKKVVDVFRHVHGW